MALKQLPQGSFSAAHPAATTLTLDRQQLRIRSVITTIDPDRAGDVIVPTGLRNTEEFLLNPVVLWAHNRTQFPPIGVCEWLDVQPRRIVAQTRLAREVPLAEDVFRLLEQGILKGWSIGFVPRRADRRPRNPPGTSQGRPAWFVHEWDLLEYSVVPIPENPAALTIALEKGLVWDRSLKDWLQELAVATPAAATRQGDVLGELLAG